MPPRRPQYLILTRLPGRDSRVPTYIPQPSSTWPFLQPEASFLPSGDQDMLRTQCLCPRKAGRGERGATPVFIPNAQQCLGAIWHIASCQINEQSNTNRRDETPEANGKPSPSARAMRLLHRLHCHFLMVPHVPRDIKFLHVSGFIILTIALEYGTKPEAPLPFSR